MSSSRHAPNLIQARAVLGLAPDAGLEAARQAFRAAAKLAHPDRPGGDAARFRQVLEAYRALQAAPALPAPYVAAAVGAPGLAELSWRVALEGGVVEVALAEGRRVRVNLPAGLRHGESIRISSEPFIVAITPCAEVMVRGNDLWVTANVSPMLLDQGRQIEVETPLGAKLVWATRNAADRRLVRLEGEGLPARGANPRGSLFIRLSPQVGPVESAARTQLRRFAAAWAA